MEQAEMCKSVAQLWPNGLEATHWEFLGNAARKYSKAKQWASCEPGKETCLSLYFYNISETW